MIALPIRSLFVCFWFIYYSKSDLYFLRKSINVASKPRSIKTVPFTIRRRGIYGSVLYIYDSLSVRIKLYYRAQKYVSLMYPYRKRTVFAT
jgi:hypothetical protein